MEEKWVCPVCGERLVDGLDHGIEYVFCGGNCGFKSPKIALAVMSGGDLMSARILNAVRGVQAHGYGRVVVEISKGEVKLVEESRTYKGEG